MNLEIKKQFKKESGKDIFVWGEDKSLAYTEAYVEWLEKKLNTSNAKDNKDLLIDFAKSFRYQGAEFLDCQIKSIVDSYIDNN